MTLVVQAADLRQAVDLCIQLIESRTTIPILKTMRLSVVPGRGLEITATNMDNRLTVYVEAAGTLEDTCLDGRLLHRLVRAVDGELAIERERTAADQPIVKIAAGGATFRLEAQPADEFPPDRTVAGEVVAGLSDFRAAIQRVRFACSTEETRYYLNGVYFEPGSAVATDGHRMAIAPMPGVEQFKPFIYPNGAAKLALQLRDMPGSVVSDGAFAEILAGPSIRLHSRLVAGMFVNYRKVIPGADQMVSRFTVQSAELLAALKMVGVLESSRKHPFGVALNFDGKALRLVAEAFGEEVDVPVQIADPSGEPFEIGVKRNYAAAMCRGTETLRFCAQAGASDPLCIEEPDGRLFLLMPMRL